MFQVSSQEGDISLLLGVVLFRLHVSGKRLGLCRTLLLSEQQASVSPRGKGGLVCLEVLKSQTGPEPVEHAGHWERASTRVCSGRL